MREEHRVKGQGRGAMSKGHRAKGQGRRAMNTERRVQDEGHRAKELLKATLSITYNLLLVSRLSFL